MISNIRPMQENWFSCLGSATMLAFAVLAGWRWSVTGSLFYALLLLRDLVAAWLLLNRKQKKTQPAALLTSLLAYGSTFLPLAYLPQAGDITSFANLASAILPVAGFTLATLALFDLNESFGVSPANRGRVSSGVYGIFKHPMYTGYAIAEASFVITNRLNLAIFLLSISLYWWRAWIEERILLSKEACDAFPMKNPFASSSQTP